MLELKSRLLFEIDAEFDDPIQIGSIPHGDRAIMTGKSGTFEGPEMRGVVVPGGGDWHLTRKDGVGEMDVRAVLKTEDGDLVYIWGHGYLHYSPEVRERMDRGEHVDPSEYYFRIAPFFETSSKKLSWLNQTIAIGVAGFTEKGVLVRYYAIL